MCKTIKINKKLASMLLNSISQLKQVGIVFTNTTVLQCNHTRTTGTFVAYLQYYIQVLTNKLLKESNDYKAF